MIHGIIAVMLFAFLMFIIEAQRRRLSWQYEMLMHLEKEIKDFRWREDRERIERVQKARHREAVQAEMDAKMDANPS